MCELQADQDEADRQQHKASRAQRMAHRVRNCMECGGRQSVVEALSYTGPWGGGRRRRSGRRRRGSCSRHTRGGYEHPIEVGGAVSTPLVLSPYGGWHGGCGNEQWTSRTTHTGDKMRRSSRTTSGSSTRLGRGRAHPTGSLPTRRWGLRWRRRHLGLCRRQRRRR